MKQSLRFQSEDEFQAFFGQLSSAELVNFLPIEGSGGDMGFDGINNTTAFQVYFPEEKNRTIANYLDKIKKDLPKVIKNKEILKIQITEWVLVVPDDLRIEVIANLLKQTKNTGIKCYYWGATKLTELVAKHPHIQDSFPLIFLPPVREGIKEIQRTLLKTSESSSKALTSEEIIRDDEYFRIKQEVEEEYQTRMKPFTEYTRGTIETIVTDEGKQARDQYEREYFKKIGELERKRDESKKYYKIELEEINELFDERLEELNEEMNRRGLFSSGIKDRAIGKLEVKRKREIEKLDLKYGKNQGLIIVSD